MTTTPVNKTTMFQPMPDPARRERRRKRELARRNEFATLIAIISLAGTILAGMGLTFWMLGNDQLAWPAPVALVVIAAGFYKRYRAAIAKCLTSNLTKDQR